MNGSRSFDGSVGDDLVSREWAPSILPPSSAESSHGVLTSWLDLVRVGVHQIVVRNLNKKGMIGFNQWRCAITYRARVQPAAIAESLERKSL